VLNEQLESLLEDHVWHETRVALTWFAAKLIRERFGSDNGPVPLLDGMESADFASHVLVNVVTNHELWDQQKFPNLREQLFSFVRYEIRNAARRHSTTHVSYADDDDEFGVDINASSPESEAEAKAFNEGFLKFLEGEDDLQLMIFAMREGHLERADIAKSLGVPPSDVTNFGKRLDRKREAYCADLGRINIISS